ncbi:MAG: serine/threonine protein kinase [Polyangiaceae bacterium]|nr:serine/threonine protein kinase [Polyangiaceae bacterium]
MSDSVPQSLSRYQVITTLGQGGMARVLLTMTRGPAGVTKLLVIKELKEELKADPEFVTMFLDEARIAARLNHPNVIQTYEVSNDGAHPIIVMEYLEGQPLNLVLSRIGRKKMPLDKHLYILSQAAAGLHYAHDLKNFDGSDLGLVHRDVSPQNVFVTYDGRVLIVDFGIAKAADSAGLTKTGVFKGKVGYAAPEQLAAGKSIDRRADVFALGVMLWEALAGKRLAQGETELAVMNRRLHGEDPNIREIAPDAPDELCQIVEKAMAHNPGDRYASAAEFRAAIDAYLDTSKRIGPEDVGSMVREAFAADREKVRSLIENQIKALQSQTVTGERPAAISLPVITETTPVRRETSEPNDSTIKVAATARTDVPPKPSGSKVPVFVVLGVIAAAVIVFLVMRTQDSKGPAAATSSPPPPGEVAAAATVSVLIDVEPRDARITLDDAQLSQNPFQGAMPKSALARKLKVSAPGFVTDERLVTLDRDINIQLVLKPEAAPTTSAAASSTSSANAAAPATTAAKTSPGGGSTPGSAQTASQPTSTGTAKGIAPGDSLTTPGQKKTRTIDDSL